MEAAFVDTYNPDIRVPAKAVRLMVGVIRWYRNLIARYQKQIAVLFAKTFWTFLHELPSRSPAKPRVETFRAV